MLVEIMPGVDVDVDTYRNACSHKALPLSMSYQALKAFSDKDIVTITYLQTVRRALQIFRCCREARRYTARFAAHCSGPIFCFAELL
ncbi:hypothetical protein ACXR0M_11875 [Pseudomonas sp. Eth.TT006]